MGGSRSQRKADGVKSFTPPELVRVTWVEVLGVLIARSDFGALLHHCEVFYKSFLFFGILESLIFEPTRSLEEFG
jgi:hypothetical protein